MTAPFHAAHPIGCCQTQLISALGVQVPHEK